MGNQDPRTFELFGQLERLRAAGADPNRPAAYRKRLSAALSGMDDAALGRFVGELRVARALLFTRTHWLAASLLAGSPCTSEAFDDFRSWVVAHGRDAFLRAVADPDALVELAPPGMPALAPLTGTTFKAYAKRQDTDAVDTAICRCIEANTDLPPEAEDHIGWSYWDAPTDAELASVLPRTWAARGAQWSPAFAEPNEFVRAADVPGLGTVRIGDRLARRGSNEVFEVLGITDNAIVEEGVTYVGGDDFRFIARVRDDGGISCGQTLSGKFQRWPHEPDSPPEPFDGELADDDDADEFEARDAEIQQRVKQALGDDAKIVYSAYDEDDDGLPVDNLDDVAYEGLIRFVEVDDTDGERFESDVLTNPTWLDVARVADAMVRTLGYQDHIYLEGLRAKKGRGGAAATGTLEMGS